MEEVTDKFKKAAESIKSVATRTSLQVALPWTAVLLAASYLFLQGYSRLRDHDVLIKGNTEAIDRQHDEVDSYYESILIHLRSIESRVERIEDYIIGARNNE
jgi:hypothetical protein